MECVQWWPHGLTTVTTYIHQLHTLGSTCSNPLRVWISVGSSSGSKLWTPSRVSILDLMLRSPHHRLIPPAVCGSWPCGAMLGPAASAVYVTSALTCSACDLLTPHWHCLDPWIYPMLSLRAETTGWVFVRHPGRLAMCIL